MARSETCRAHFPKGRKSQKAVLHEVLFKPIQVKGNDGYRTLPKITVAVEVCLNNALKGDLKSFVKIMEFAQKYGLFDLANDPDNRITAIELIVGSTPIRRLRVGIAAMKSSVG